MGRMKLCMLTAARSEYGLLRPIIQKLIRMSEFDVRIVVTGMHLSPEFGLTYREIEEDGILIDRKIEMLLSADTPAAISKSMGLAMIGFADYFAERRPDLLMILGDRYEALPVAAAALNERIPIAHLYGGDLTEGAIDDVIRHCLTKMSHLHFVSTEAHRRRVIQLGENPDRVYRVGAMSAESALTVKLLTREELTTDLNFDWGTEQLIVVTYHPETLENQSTEEQCFNLIEALDEINHIKIVFTKANADVNGRVINRMIDEYVEKHSQKARVYTSLGQQRYLSAVALADAVVGNSSSGLSEVPSFHIPTVNVGNRQKGREMGKSVISCGNEKEQIKSAIEQALSTSFRNNIKDVKNPYEMEGTSAAIVEILRRIAATGGVGVQKRFYDLEW